MGEILTICILTLVLVLFLIPMFFNQLKKLWYLKHGSGIKKMGMYYDAKKGKIESTNSEKI